MATSTYTTALINDHFAANGLRWAQARPLDAEHATVQYDSPAYGGERVVRVHAAGLLKWLHEHRQPNWRARLSAMLDKKPEHEEPLRQQEFDLGSAPAIARRSMSPQEGRGV